MKAEATSYQRYGWSVSDLAREYGLSRDTSAAPAASRAPDRLIDNAIVINIRGRSYRMRAHQDSTNGKNGR